MKPGIRLFLILLVPGIAGCQHASDGKAKLMQMLMLGAASSRVSQAQGGTIQTATMSLSVPQGALEGDTTITYANTSLPAVAGPAVPTQAAYKFEPEGLQFNKPVTLKVCYDEKDVAAQGLQEKTMQIQYYDPDTGELTSMGGEVDFDDHCVSAEIYHFSTYILTAQLLAVGNNPPTIGGANFFPARPLAGQPLTVRSVVTDWDAGSAIANVTFYYRRRGSGAAFKSIAMTPDANDGTGQVYSAKIPGTDITAAGLDYYLMSSDSLNAVAKRPAAAPTAYSTILGDNPAATNPIRFQTTIDRMSAGFSRDLTVQVRGASSATYYPVVAETLTFDGDKGTTSRPTWLSARYTAKKIGASALKATYGTLPELSVPISVYPGVLDRIVVLYNDAELSDPFTVNGNSVTQFDAAGYDANDNFMFVQPAFTASPGLGTFGDAAHYGQFTAADLPATDGTITVTVGAYSKSYNIHVNPHRLGCKFDAATFDGACVYN